MKYTASIIKLPKIQLVSPFYEVCLVIKKKLYDKFTLYLDVLKGYTYLLHGK